VKTLFDYFENGHALDEFLEDFPTVKVDHAVSVLELMREKLLETSL
jgi:hypothetical protein